MIINLCSPRVISYRITQVDNIDKIEYIISFPSGISHSFPVDVDRTTGECTIKLPILKDIISVEFDGIGYIKLMNTGGTIMDLHKEEVHFVSAATITLTKEDTNVINFNDKFEPVNKVAFRTNEVLVSHSNTLDFIMGNIDRNKKETK